MTEYVIRHRGGFYNKSWSPVAAHEATRYQTHEEARVKAETLDAVEGIVCFQDAISETVIDSYDLHKRVQSLTNARAVWYGKYQARLRFARNILDAHADDLSCGDIQNAVTSLLDALAARAQVIGFDESIGLIEVVLDGKGG